jgi:hypothetical protein
LRKRKNVQGREKFRGENTFYGFDNLVLYFSWQGHRNPVWVSEKIRISSASLPLPALLAPPDPALPLPTLPLHKVRGRGRERREEKKREEGGRMERGGRREGRFMKRADCGF